MNMKLHSFYPSGVGGNFIEEATRILHKRIEEIIAANNLGESILRNSLEADTITCQVYIVCPDDIISLINTQLKDLFDVGQVRVKTITRNPLNVDLRIFGTEKQEVLRHNESRCVCGQLNYLQAPATECKSCMRLLLPRGVIQTTRHNGDNREYVFFKSDGSILGTDKPVPGQIKHPWFG